MWSLPFDFPDRNCLGITRIPQDCRVSLEIFRTVVEEQWSDRSSHCCVDGPIQSVTERCGQIWAQVSHTKTRENVRINMCPETFNL
jgi:hypothetical protein